jgi:hypothetical protein
MSSEIKSCPNALEPWACKTEIAATETMIEERIRPRFGRRNHLRLASMRSGRDGQGLPPSLESGSGRRTDVGLDSARGGIAVPEPQGRDRTVDHRGARFGEGGLRR